MALWIAAFIGQLAWTFDMEIGYLLVYWACDTKQHWVLPFSTAVAFVIALAGFAYSWRESQRIAAISGDVSGAGAVHLDRFVAIAGITLNFMAMAVILGMGVPRVMLDPCSR